MPWTTNTFWPMKSFDARGTRWLCTCCSFPWKGSSIACVLPQHFNFYSQVASDLVPLGSVPGPPLEILSSLHSVVTLCTRSQHLGQHPSQPQRAGLGRALRGDRKLIPGELLEHSLAGRGRDRAITSPWQVGKGLCLQTHSSLSRVDSRELLPRLSHSPLCGLLAQEGGGRRSKGRVMRGFTSCPGIPGCGSSSWWAAPWLLLWSSVLTLACLLSHPASVPPVWGASTFLSSE